MHDQRASSRPRNLTQPIRNRLIDTAIGKHSLAMLLLHTLSSMHQLTIEAGRKVLVCGSKYARRPVMKFITRMLKIKRWGTISMKEGG
eukprot:4219288-Amphidinium_carterae.1